MAKVTYQNNVTGKKYTVEEDVFKNLQKRTPGRYTLVLNSELPSDVQSKEKEIATSKPSEDAKTKNNKN